MRRMKKILTMGVLNSLALFAVCCSVNQMSMWFFHQPKMLKCAEILKKH